MIVFAIGVFCGFLFAIIVFSLLSVASANSEEANAYLIELEQAPYRFSDNQE